METFRDLSPQEIQHTLLMFMGQNMGDLKELDRSIHSKNVTLQGLTLQPENILRTIPNQPVAAPKPTPAHVESTHTPSPSQIVEPQQLPAEPITNNITTVTTQPPPQDHPDQLLFDFVHDIQKDKSIVCDITQTSKTVSRIEFYAKEILSKLKAIESQNEEILSVLNKKKPQE